VPYTLDNKVALIGYTAALSPPASGASTVLTATLYWRARAQMDTDYTVFVQLFDASGTLYGQGDGPPLHNDYPTSYWLPGDVLADPHTLSLAHPFSPGSYLLVGLYRSEDGARLPAYTETGARVTDDAIRLELGVP